MSLRLHNLTFALLCVLTSTGCADQPTLTRPADSIPSSIIQEGPDGVIRAALELPFDLDPDYPDTWSAWGRFPDHEELRIPPGPHEIDFEVTGGVRFVRKPGVQPWEVNHLDDVFIGPGGIRVEPDEWFPALRLQMGYVPAEFEGQGYPPMYAWQAEPYSMGPAHARVVLTGPGRIIFNRHYNSNFWNGLGRYNWEGRQAWTLYDVIADQRVVLTARPLSGSLKLDCGSGSVTRGDSLTCHVKAEPSGRLTDIQWAFVDSAGHRITGPSGMDSWGGTMVVGGEMQVTAQLDGDPQTRTERIIVGPRTWPRMTLIAADSGNGHLPQQPTSTDQLADTHPPIPSRSIEIRSIATGPNTGWAYLPTPIASVTVAVHINGGFQRGTPLYQKQRSGVDPVTGQPFCTKNQFTSAIQTAARQHEGLVSGPTPSHVAVYRRWFNNNTPQDSMEAVIGFLSDFSADYPFGAFVDAEFDEHVASAARHDPDQNHPNETPPGLVSYPTVPCRPRLYP